MFAKAHWIYQRPQESHAEKHEIKNVGVVVGISYLFEKNMVMLISFSHLRFKYNKFMRPKWEHHNSTTYSNIY